MRWRMMNVIGAVLALTYGAGCGLMFLIQSIQWNIGWDSLPVLVFAILLIGGGVAVLVRKWWGPRTLAAGWGAMFGAFTANYFASSLMRAVDASWGEGSYSVDPGPLLMGALLSVPIVSLLGIILAITDRSER